MEIERRSQCVIEGIDKDKILIRFTHIDPSDLQREFSFVIDVSAKVYKGMQGVKYFKCLLIARSLSTNNESFPSESANTSGRAERVKRHL